MCAIFIRTLYYSSADIKTANHCRERQKIRIQSAQNDIIYI